jgi:hypothetical protein
VKPILAGVLPAASSSLPSPDLSSYCVGPEDFGRNTIVAMAVRQADVSDSTQWGCFVVAPLYYSGS